MQEIIKKLEEEIEKERINKKSCFWEISFGKIQGLQRAIEIIKEGQNGQSNTEDTIRNR